MSTERPRRSANLASFEMALAPATRRMPFDEPHPLVERLRSSPRGASREFRLAALNLLEDVAEARRKSDRAEAEARDAWERYRALFTQMDQGLGIAEIQFEGDVPVDFRWVDVNGQFEKVTGISRAKALEGGGMRSIAPGLEPEWLETFAKVARTGESVRFERRSQFLGRWLDVNALRIGDAVKRQIVVLVNDATQRVRQAADLAFQMALADDWSRVSSVDAIARVTDEGCSKHFRVRACELVEIGPGAPKRDPKRELVEPIGRVGERELALAVIDSKPREWTREETELVQALVRQLHPALLRATAEDALRASRERLRLIVENARDFAIVTMDRARQITSWNPGAERMTGYAADEVVGQTADLIFTPEGRAEGAPEREAETAIAEGRASDERWHVRKDGSRFWGSGSMLAMRDGAGEAMGLLKIFRDQTTELRAKEVLERSRRELWDALQETERARKDAESAGRAKDQLFAVLSHELRTPLTPVMFGTEMLLMRDDIATEVREALVMVQRNVALEARLVDDLLDVTRIRHGKVELMFSAMDLHDAVQQALEVAKPDFAERRQQLVVALDAKQDRVMGDVTRLKQVVWNILKNASKFTPEGGRIGVTTRNEPGRVVIEVTDTGIGIDPAMVSRIFDSFTQVDASITRTFGGLGLGLAIAKGIIERHGGRIEAHSPGVGQGATVVIGLPLAPAGGDK